MMAYGLWISLPSLEKKEKCFIIYLLKKKVLVPFLVLHSEILSIHRMLNTTMEETAYSIYLLVKNKYKHLSFIDLCVKNVYFMSHV